MAGSTFAFILAALVGAAIVVQNGTSAELMKNANLWLLLAASNLVAVAGALTIFAFKRDHGSLGEELGRLPLALIIPGVCGLIIIAGMPVAISKIGVSTTVMIVIGCQIVAGLAWDRFYAQTPISATQLVGAVIVAVGVLLVMRPPGTGDGT